MASQAFSPRPPQMTDRAVEAEVLLNRYPDITERELESLKRAFVELPLLDFGLLAADDRLADRLEAFCRDHGRELRAPSRALALSLAVPAAVAVGLLVWALG